MRFKFKLLIFQDGVLDEELETIEEFADAMDLAQRIIGFAAMESRVAIHPKVARLYSRGSTITLPSTRNGYGPMTSVVIGKVVLL